MVSTLRRNIERYRQQLATDPGANSRRFIERCLAAEEAMLERLTGPSET
jgi:hypothetical protein